MDKYYEGKILIDMHNSDGFYEVIAVAPDLDYEGIQSYFVEVLDKSNKYYVSYNQEFLNTNTY